MFIRSQGTISCLVFIFPIRTTNFWVLLVGCDVTPLVEDVCKSKVALNSKKASYTMARVGAALFGKGGDLD